jgi:hypothetical protein
MAFNYAGGQVAPSGIYWNRTRGEFVNYTGEGELEGDRTERYWRAPLPVVLVLGPVMGLAFAIFLPLSGLMVLLPFLAGKVRETVFEGRFSAAHMASTRPLPGVSYLDPQSGTSGTKSRKDDGAKGGDAEDGKLVDLASEISRRQEKN